MANRLQQRGAGFQEPAPGHCTHGTHTGRVCPLALFVRQGKPAHLVRQHPQEEFRNTYPRNSLTHTRQPSHPNLHPHHNTTSANPNRSQNRPQQSRPQKANNRLHRIPARFLADWSVSEHHRSDSADIRAISRRAQINSSPTPSPPSSPPMDPNAPLFVPGQSIHLSSSSRRLDLTSPEFQSMRSVNSQQGPSNAASGIEQPINGPVANLSPAITRLVAEQSGPSGPRSGGSTSTGNGDGSNLADIPRAGPSSGQVYIQGIPRVGLFPPPGPRNHLAEERNYPPNPYHQMVAAGFPGGNSRAEEIFPTLRWYDPSRDMLVPAEGEFTRSRIPLIPSQAFHGQHAAMPFDPPDEINHIPPFLLTDYDKIISDMRRLDQEFSVLSNTLARRRVNPARLLEWGQTLERINERFRFLTLSMEHLECERRGERDNDSTRHRMPPPRPEHHPMGPPPQRYYLGSLRDTTNRDPSHLPVINAVPRAHTFVTHGSPMHDATLERSSTTASIGTPQTPQRGFLERSMAYPSLLAIRDMRVGERPPPRYRGAWMDFRDPDAPIWRGPLPQGVTINQAANFAGQQGRGLQPEQQQVGGANGGATGANGAGGAAGGNDGGAAGGAGGAGGPPRGNGAGAGAHYAQGSGRATRGQQIPVRQAGQKAQGNGRQAGQNVERNAQQNAPRQPTGRAQQSAQQNAIQQPAPRQLAQGTPQQDSVRQTGQNAEGNVQQPVPRQSSVATQLSSTQQPAPRQPAQNARGHTQPASARQTGQNAEQNASRQPATGTARQTATQQPARRPSVTAQQNPAPQPTIQTNILNHENIAHVHAALLGIQRDQFIRQLQTRNIRYSEPLPGLIPREIQQEASRLALEQVAVQRAIQAAQRAAQQQRNVADHARVVQQTHAARNAENTAPRSDSSDEARPLTPVNPEMDRVTDAMPSGYWSGRFSGLSDRLQERFPNISDNERSKRVMVMLRAKCGSEEAVRSFKEWRRVFVLSRSYR